MAVDEVMQSGERYAKRRKTVMELEANVPNDGHGIDETGGLGKEECREKANQLNGERFTEAGCCRTRLHGSV